MPSRPDKDMLKALEAFDAAAEQLARVVEETRKSNSRFTAAYHAGESVLASLQLARSTAMRIGLAEAIEDMEMARRRARGHLLLVGRGDGENVTALARALGISRQLAYRSMDDVSPPEG
jgi:hypothetical protein